MSARNLLPTGLVFGARAVPSPVSRIPIGAMLAAVAVYYAVRRHPQHRD